MVGATVTDTFPDTLTGVAWTAVITGSGSATLAGTGDINELIDLTSGSTITYTVTGTFAGSLTPDQAVQRIVTNAATVTAPAGLLDPNQSNNKDYDSDLVVLAATGGTGTFYTGQSLANLQSLGVSLGDVDGDGDLDAFVVSAFQANHLWVNQGGIVGQFADSGQSLGGSNDTGRGVSLGDLDGDGDLDAFVANYLNRPNRIWANDGSGNFIAGQGLGSFDSFDVSLGDLDGDGDLDAFVAGRVDSSRVWVNNDNKPTVVNPIANVVVDEDAPNTVIDLSNVFEDLDVVTDGDILTLKQLTLCCVELPHAPERCCVVGSTMSSRQNWQRSVISPMNLL